MTPLSDGMVFNLSIDDVDLIELMYRTLEQGCVPDPNIVTCVNDGSLQFRSDEQPEVVKVVARSVKSLGFPLGARQATIIEKAACDNLGSANPSVLLHLVTALWQNEEISFEVAEWFYVPMTQKVQLEKYSFDMFEIFLEEATFSHFDGSPSNFTDAYDKLPDEILALHAGFHHRKDWFHAEDIFFFVAN